MIFAPPQHGKSELVSVRLPAFWLGRRPDDPVILASYAASLAHSKSRQARKTVESDSYQSLFDAIRTDRSSRSVELWELDGRRGGLRAAGVGGGIAGNPAMLGIIDDPVKNWQEAQSETLRDRAWEWWRKDFRPRVWEDGAIVIIQTRWHEDDLSGRILQQQADQWTVLRLPALAETQEERDFHNKRMNLPTGQPDPLGRKPSQPLAPMRFSKKALLEIRKTVGIQGWGALYQAAPTLPEGNRFKRGWFEIIDALPVGIKSRMRYWDNAATQDGGKRTAGILMSIANDDTIIIEDAVVGQWATANRNNVVRQTAQLDHQKHSNRGRMMLEQEPGSAGVDAANAIIRFMAGFSVSPDRPTGDKDTRLEPFASQAGAGNVKLLRGSWNADYIEEMCAVPNGKFRDQADATAGAYNNLAGSSVSVVNLGAALAKLREQ